MSNSKMTKRALLTSIMALMLCFAMLTGTTFAWFTDQETSGNNRIVAGNLDVDFLMYKDGGYTSIAGGVGDIFSEGATANASNATLWEPGATHVAYLAVENKGNLALKYNIALNIKDNGLAEALEYIIVDEYEYTGASSVAKWADLKTQYTAGQVAGGNFIAAPNGKLVPATTDYFALVVHMKEDAGNEYMDKNIVIDVIVQATQLANEEDAFGPEYDEPAEFRSIGTGAIKVDLTQNMQPIENRDENGAKWASFEVPTAALATGTTIINTTVDKVEVDGNITIGSNQAAQSYEITVDGIKEGNTEKIKTSLRIGVNLSNVVVYHKGVQLDSADVSYDPSTGYVTFETTSFSPFTVVYDVNYIVPDSTGVALPVAKVTAAPEFVGTDLEWGSYGQWSPTPGLDNQLEAAYVFETTQTTAEVDASPYADWYCDFVVKLDKPLAANQIFLGGNYGSFGWIGFHNGDLELDANTEIPLLGSVTTNPWTYESVAKFVGTFICGVGDVDDALADATFTVMLRLTNPENEAEFYNVATINHTFAKGVSSGEELQDAINNGNSNIILEGDIDLSNGIVIP